LAKGAAKDATEGLNELGGSVGCPRQPARMTAVAWLGLDENADAPYLGWKTEPGR
jgi:hypothetical protein